MLNKNYQILLIKQSLKSLQETSEAFLSLL